MKRFAFLFALLSSSLFAFSQEEPAFICRLGFTFEMSVQESWGYNKPVVLTVSPNTAADAAGLKVGDIIEEIDGKSTKEQMFGTIASWLRDSPKDQIELVTQNLEDGRRKMTLKKHCRFTNAITEKDLASVYSFYSLEDMLTASFVCPFKTISNTKSDLLNFRTFGFTKVDTENEQLETKINIAIRYALEKKGLKYSDKKPDLLVHTYYSFNKNLNYKKHNNSEKFPIVSRYNTNSHEMENLPVYYDPLVHPNQAEYFLKLGVQLIRHEASKNSEAKIVWECEANELIQSGSYTLDKYATLHIPLMLTQYPYIHTTETALFWYSRAKYNYTGINYNLNDLNKITDVDDSSPASKSGLQRGDIVEKINGIKFNSKPKSADNNYKQFILKTMFLRDPKTRFTNAEGFTKCMYWDKLKYAQIYDEFKNPGFSTTFSYLFYFEPYVNLSGTNIVTFTVARGKIKEDIKVRPVIVSEEVLMNKKLHE